MRTTKFAWVSKPSRLLSCVYVPNRACVWARGPFRMLQMVRTLAQFSIALEEMNENGENTGDEGGGGGCGGGGGGGRDRVGEEVLDRDAVAQFRNNNGNGNASKNLNGNGLCAGSPNGEVVFVIWDVCACCQSVAPLLLSSNPRPTQFTVHFILLLNVLSPLFSCCLLLILWTLSHKDNVSFFRSTALHPPVFLILVYNQIRAEWITWLVRTPTITNTPS